MIEKYLIAKKNFLTIIKNILNNDWLKIHARRTDNNLYLTCIETGDGEFIRIYLYPRLDGHRLEVVHPRPVGMFGDGSIETLKASEKDLRQLKDIIELLNKIPSNRNLTEGIEELPQ